MSETLNTVRVEWRGQSFCVPANFVSGYVNDNGFIFTGHSRNARGGLMCGYEHPDTGERFYCVIERATA